MTKEEIYDDKINPLMAQIIEIAREHKIAMVASFSINHSGGEDFDLCTTTLTTDEYDPPQQFRDMVNVLFTPKPQWCALTITTRKD